MKTPNVAASVRARLLQIAKTSGEDFNLTLTRENSRQTINQEMTRLGFVVP